MIDLMLVLYFAAGIATAIAVLLKTQLIYEYPFFMTMTFLGVFGPQVLVLRDDHAFLPPDSFERVMILMNLCILGCWLGYLLPVKPGTWTWIAKPLSVGRLQWGGLVLGIVGSLFSLAAVTFGEENIDRDDFNNTTGTFTILLFFTNLFSPSLAIMSNLFFRGKFLIPAIGILLSIWFPVYVALTSGRRESTVLMMLVILTTLYFVRKIRVPWWLLLPGVLFISIMVQIIGEYRSFVITEGVGAALEFDVTGNFAKAREQRRAHEICNACLQTDYVHRIDTFNFGVKYWNTMVYRFVPAQFVGQDFKASLLFTVPPPLIGRLQDYPEYAPPGTTPTGMADSYAEFGYFGWLVFAVLGYITKIVWKLCIQGSFAAQVIYASSLTSLMRAVTHQTIDTPPGIAFVLISVWAVFFYARVRAVRP